MKVAFCRRRGKFSTIVASQNTQHLCSSSLSVICVCDIKSDMEGEIERERQFSFFYPTKNVE
jgi:hypothetical protein